MELIEGKTLRELLVAGMLPLQKAIEIAAQVAEGLAKAHEAGRRHRDLKPENVWSRPDGLVKILDFGLAKRAPLAGEPAEPRKMSTWQTTTGLVMGTVQYMSPEQASADKWISDQTSFHLGAGRYEWSREDSAFS